jgi:plastocyanin
VPRSTLTFENNDSDAGGIHNVSIYPDAASTTQLLTTGPATQGPETQTAEPGTFDDPGTFQFRCDVHTVAMVGTFIVVEAP